MTRTARLTRTLVLGLAMAALLGGIAAPARADDDDWHRREWRQHERREHEWRERQAWCAYHPYACGYPQGYVYAAPPPPVIYAPPPPPPIVYAPPAAGLSIILPIHIK